MARQTSETFDCPNCGADVPAGALSCPECGSDDETGWSEDAAYDCLDLPEPYDDDPHLQADPPRYKTAFYALTAVVLLVAFFWALSRGGRLW